MGKATGWGDFQKNWHLEHPNHGEESHGTCKRSIRHCLKQLHRNICTSLKCYRSGAPYDKRGHDGCLKIT